MNLFIYQNLPDDILIKIIKMLFEHFPQEASKSISSLMIILSKFGNMKLINTILQGEETKHVFNLLTTDTWVRVIVSMGFNKVGLFEDKKTFWNEKNVNYQKKYVNKSRYTSRAHGLLDLLDHSDKIMQKTARVLLDKLIKVEPTKEGKDFLKGNIVKVKFQKNMTDLEKMYDKDKLKIFCFDDQEDLSLAFECLNENVSCMRFWDIRELDQIIFSIKITGELDLRYWDTSNLQKTIGMFRNSIALLTGLENWNTCRVTNMSDMFVNNRFFNCDISEWDTTQVVSTKNMFAGAFTFDQNLKWNTRNIENMQGMFIKALSYNNGGQPLLWNTRKVTNTSSMFLGALKFNGDMSNWDTCKVLNMACMFMDAKLFNKPLVWNTQNVLDMSNMFQNAISFNQSLFTDTSNVQNMGDMFSGAISFNSDISKWNTSKVKNMSCMFMNATVFNSDISKWNTENVLSMTFMFMKASSFNQVLKWNIKSLIDNGASLIFRDSQGRFDV